MYHVTFNEQFIHVITKYKHTDKIEEQPIVLPTPEEKPPEVVMNTPVTAIEETKIEENEDAKRRPSIIKKQVTPSGERRRVSVKSPPRSPTPTPVIY